MTVKAIPIVSIGGVTPGSISLTNPSGETREITSGYTTMCPMSGTVYVLAKPESDPSDDATWPTAQNVVDNGMPATSTLPFYIQDPWGSPSFPDLRKYFVATVTGTADLRVGN